MKGEELDEGDADMSNDEWLEDNYVDLVQKYPRLWIAVMDQQVLCDGATRASVEAKARKIAGDREFSVYFIAPTSLQM